MIHCQRNYTRQAEVRNEAERVEPRGGSFRDTVHRTVIGAPLLPIGLKPTSRSWSYGAGILGTQKSHMSRRLAQRR
jgi:hypothetical protein